MSVDEFKIPDRPTLETAMRVALTEARAALEHYDVPIGAVLLNPKGDVVAQDHNRREERVDPTAHAEMLVLSSAAQASGDWRLEHHTLVVTLEPCPMCAGAASWARVGAIAYGPADFKSGAAYSLYNIPQDARLNHHSELVSGVLEEEGAALLTEFFTTKR